MRSTGTVTCNDLEAESSAVFSTVMELIVRESTLTLTSGSIWTGPRQSLHCGPPPAIARQPDLSQHSAALPGHPGPPGRLNPANPGLLNRPGVLASSCGARKGEAQCAHTSQCFLRCCVPAVATRPNRQLPQRGLCRSEPRPRVS